MKQLYLLLITLFSFNSAFGTGEPSTYFNIFVPPNNNSVNRHVALIVTAIFDSTYIEIIDDDADGDSDDSYTGYLMAGQSYITNIKDNGVNDDAQYASGGILKSDGDYFIITATKIVYASQSTDSDWQHDWVPATNRSSIGQKFVVYSPATSYSNRDLNVFAYSDSTTVTVRKISVTPTTTSGATNVDNSLQDFVMSVEIDIGEDIIHLFTDGRDLLEPGETYIVESNKPITMQYGALWTNSRDGGGYVPSSNGSSSGELFYFAVRYQVSQEQEIRIVSWDDDNSVTLDYYNAGTWVSLGAWEINDMGTADWVGADYGLTYATTFRISCDSGKKVSVFEANWMETGSPGTSDIATMVSAESGTTSGVDFLVYMTPPGSQYNVVNPITSSVYGGKFTHVYLFAKDSATVIVKDAYSNGETINRSYDILPGRYVDCYLSEAEWKSIYNGDGNPDSGQERPYLLINSTSNISVMNTNFNDNWMMYFGSSQEQSFDQSGVSSSNSGIPGETITITSTILFENTDSITSPEVTVIVGTGAIPISSELNNITEDLTIQGDIVSTDENSVVTFEDEPTLISSNLYTVKTTVELQVNYYNGDPIPSNTVINIETTVSGYVDEEYQQSVGSQGIQNKSEQTDSLLFSLAPTQPFTATNMNTWTSNWVDYDGDNDDDLFLVSYDHLETHRLYRNNGGSFEDVSKTNLTDITRGSIAASWVDFDNDGDRECFIPKNQGEQNTFSINESGNFLSLENDPILDSTGYYHGITFADYDNDGYLDAFLSDFMPTNFNRLFKGSSDGTFALISEATPSQGVGRSIGSTWADYDNDGDQDLFVPNGNGQNNAFYINNGDGTFTKDTISIIANDGLNCVASCWGDYDNDGYLDLFVSNGSNGQNLLYHNDGDGTFTQITTGELGTDKGYSHGCSWADIDNDKDLDLFVSNDQGQAKYLYMNDGSGNFTRNNNELITTAQNNSYSHQWSDYDQDGDLDLYVCTHSDEANVFYTNNGTTNNWLELKLVGLNSNKSAIGARIRVKCDGIWQIREINSQSGFGGQHSLTQHFGLGTSTVVDSIHILWPSGYSQYTISITANQKKTIEEDNASLITGYVFNDLNEDCVKDISELGIANVPIHVDALNITVYSNADGFYQLRLGVGTHTITQLDVPYWTTVVCTTQTVIINTLDDTAENINFSNTMSDIGVDLIANISHTAHRRGFKNVSHLNIQNAGTIAQTTDVIVTVDYPNGLIPISANPEWSSKIGSTYNWLNPSLAVNETQMIVISDSVSIEESLGEILTVTGSIQIMPTELDESNNSFTNSGEVVGAVDPNDIIVTPKGIGDEGLILPDQVLTYKIRFQNVGSFSARNIKVSCEIPIGIDLNSINFIQASHPNLLSKQNRMLTWYFENIELPDSISNEPLSHGYVEFSCQPIPDCPPHTFIINSAEIRFDFEKSVETNKVINTILNAPPKDQVELFLFPNPTKDVIYFYFDEDNPFDKIDLYGLSGEKLNIKYQINNGLVKLNIAQLPKGIYLIKVLYKTEQIQTGKIVLY